MRQKLVCKLFDSVLRVHDFITDFITDFMKLPILFQIDCQNLLSTALLQVVSPTCTKYANDRLQQA